VAGAVSPHWDLPAGVVAQFDDLVQVGQHLLVHFGQAVRSRVGRGDDLQHLFLVLVVLGQELGGGEEHRAGQAGVCAAAFLHGQAVLLGSAWVARPRRCLAQAASASGPPGPGHRGPGDVDLAGGFPVLCTVVPFRRA
jgi:hypothetical protein